MTETYSAVIFGHEREILGWTDNGTLALADGSQLAIVSQGGVALPGRIWRIARLRFEDGNWWLDGQILPKPYYDDGNLFIDKRDCPAAICYLEDGNWWLDELNRPTARCFTPDSDPAKFELGRITHLDTVSGLAVTLKLSEHYKGPWRHEVVAVAWLKDSFIERPNQIIEECGEILPETPRPQAKGYAPYLLTRCDFLVNSQTPTALKDSPAEWFTSYASAAKYLKVSARTIGNWKNRGWLPVEQVGRKIRIARTALDKCRNRQ
jgi:excisionase family DNA binding protein